jgi:acyl-CoA thioesterase-1
MVEEGRMIAGYGRLLLLALILACRAEPREPAVNSGAPPVAPAARDDRPAILFLGTSLTAGYGLSDPDREAFPALIRERIDSAGLPWRVIAAGVSGESSAGALSRIDWLLERERVAILVLETGANDGLRGQEPDTVRARIQAIFDRALREAPPPRLVLAGMEALPNLGQDYVRRFRAVFPEAARVNQAELIPFLLAGVGGIDSLNQRDGIHPTAAGHRILAANVWKVLEPLVRAP